MYLTHPYGSQSKFSSRIWQPFVLASVAYTPVNCNICLTYTLFKILVFITGVIYVGDEGVKILLSRKCKHGKFLYSIKMIFIR